MLKHLRFFPRHPEIVPASAEGGSPAGNPHRRHSELDPLYRSGLIDGLPVVLTAIVAAFGFLFVFASRAAEPLAGRWLAIEGALYVTLAAGLGVAAGMAAGFAAKNLTDREECGVLAALIATTAAMALLLI